MEEFFEKIKKKFSVDNILDLMKDGKLTEEIKQSLTATMNLNEKPKQEDVRSADISKNMIDPKTQITVENIQHNTAEDQTPGKLNEHHNLEEENEIQKKTSGPDLQADKNVMQKKASKPNLQSANIELNEKNNFLDKNVIQKQVSKPNLQAAIIKLNESINMLDKTEIKKKASKPNLIRPDTTEGSDTEQRLASTASDSIEEVVESDKSNVRVLQKPLIMPSQTEQVESKTQFDDFLNLT